MTFTEMRVGVPYIVTRDSNDGSFISCDQITLLENGAIINQQADGWLDEDDLSDATSGMECEVDRARIQRRKDRLLKRLADLEALDE